MQTTAFKAPRALRGDVRRGLLVGLTPLARLVVIAGVALFLTALARALTTSLGFFTQQQVSVLVLGAGLLLAAVMFGAGCVRALRQVGRWQRARGAAPATVALWSLGATALLLLLPVLLAWLLPQHPAP
jgi:predicted transporter